MDWEKGFVAGNRDVFIGSCPWLWNNWVGVAAHQSLVGTMCPAFPLDWVCRALDFSPCHHLTPQGAFPDSSSTLEVQACTRSCSTPERHSLRVQHLLVLWDRLDPEGSAPSVAAPGGAGHEEGLVWGWSCPSSGSGGHHSNPSFGLAQP